MKLSGSIAWLAFQLLGFIDLSFARPADPQPASSNDLYPTLPIQPLAVQWGPKIICFTQDPDHFFANENICRHMIATGKERSSRPIHADPGQSTPPFYWGLGDCSVFIRDTHASKDYDCTYGNVVDWMYKVFNGCRGEGRGGWFYIADGWIFQVGGHAFGVLPPNTTMVS